MPSTAQMLFIILMHAKAKVSTITNTPANLWHPPSEIEKTYLYERDPFDFHQSYSITFEVQTQVPSPTPIPLTITAYFVNPQWNLVHPFDITLIKLWQHTKKTKTPSIIYKADSTQELIPRSWFLLKQNDIDLQRLIISRIIQNTPFILPFTDFLIIPLGLTPPQTPLHSYPTPPKTNTDPNSHSNIRKGHKLYYSEAMPQQWIFNPPRDWKQSWVTTR